MDRYGQSYDPNSDEHAPVTWWRGHPVYAAYLIAAIYTASMLVTTVLQFAHVTWYQQWLSFESSLVYHGQVWRVLTYGLINPPSIGFVFQMLFIWWAGREVERYLGRKTFLWFYGSAYVLTPLIVLALGWWWPMGPLRGASGSFALFIAFATIYPGFTFRLLLGPELTAKVAAILLVAIMTLVYFAGRDWADLLSLWATCGYAFAFVRHHQGLLDLPDLRFWKRRPKLRVLPDLPEKKASAAPLTPKGTSMAEVDALLDKIAQSGYASLTAKERAKLDSARADMLKRDAKRAP